MARITLNSNLASLNAQRRLADGTASLRQSFERLSSGLRINRASDDAAGLAVASVLSVDRRVYAQGVRNINDGISYLNVAEGAAGELTGVLIRLRELATQSSNGTISQRQRQALDKEAQALRNEYNRIIETAEFNGVQVLKADELVLQAGYGDGGRLVARLGASATVTVGDGTFQAAQSYAAGSNPVAVYAGDFNGNGILDLAVANRTFSGSVSVLLGNGDGTYQAAQPYAVGNNPEAVYAGDFNGNGVLDLVVANRSSGTVSVLLGNGDGTFQAAQNYSASGPSSVVAEDLNGNGVLDLIVGSFNSGAVLVFLGNGDGTFQAAQTNWATSQVGDVFTGDFNGNGVLDIVAAETTLDVVSVFLGNGDGTFQTAQDYSVGTNPRSVFAGDFNGNGVLDLVVAAGTNVGVALGNGDGTFQPIMNVLTGFSGTSVTAGDFNGDGALDLAVASGTFTNNVSVLLGNGDGTFQVPNFYSVGDRPESVFAGDFNGDGLLDLVTADRNTGTVSVLLGNAVTITQTVSIRPLAGISVASRSSALESQGTIDGYIEEVGIVAGIFGAAVSRFEAAASTTAVSAENFQAAESRIVDSDISEEAAHLVKNEILQQAGAAVLAQANQAPALALTLLRG